MEFEDIVDKINAYLHNCLLADNTHSSKLFEAMRYSVSAGGKRLRPLLCILTYSIFRNDWQRVLPVASAIELIHTYSLIHDDLPAMDNDDYRRGLLTNHKVFGEDMAILAGDGLLSLAFEVIGKAITEWKLTPKIITLIARKCGPYGMVGGQSADINSSHAELSSSTLEFIHLHKTADMIEASVLSGALAANATDSDIFQLRFFARNIGLAFQITDDILDINGDPSRLGKSVGKDQEQKKLTYPALYGVEKSRKIAEDLANDAKKMLSHYGEKAAGLLAISNFVLERNH